MRDAMSLILLKIGFNAFQGELFFRFFKKRGEKITRDRTVWLLLGHRGLPQQCMVSI